jgi:hypothetical protein
MENAGFIHGSTTCGGFSGYAAGIWDEKHDDPEIPSGRSQKGLRSRNPYIRRARRSPVMSPCYQQATTIYIHPTHHDDHR